MRLFIWFFIFCPIMVFGQKWQSYTNTQKVNVAKQVSAEIYANIEQRIPEYRRPFIQRFGWLAVYDYNEYGVLASVKIAQGGLECGWGAGAAVPPDAGSFIVWSAEGVSFIVWSGEANWPVFSAGEEGSFIVLSKSFSAMVVLPSLESACFS
jgi:hypothetical protein